MSTLLLKYEYVPVYCYSAQITANQNLITALIKHMNANTGFSNERRRILDAKVENYSAIEYEYTHVISIQ